MPQYKLQFEANDTNDAQQKANALSVLAKNIPTADLLFLATKVQKDPQGLVNKLHQFKAFI